MNTDKFQNKYRIPSARAVWHNYNGGEYFVTICTAQREHYFGKIQNGEMVYTALGHYAIENLERINAHYPYCQIPLFVVMPNHIHAIVVIDDVHNNGNIPDDVHNKSDDVHNKSDDVHIVSTVGQQRLKNAVVDEKMQSISHQRGRLSTAMGGVKRAITRFANENKIIFGWQTRFHDHIVRNQNEMNTIADYITHNPLRWETDKFYTE